MAHSDKLVSVGQVIKARGLRGELKVESLSDFSERFGHLNTVKLELKNGEVKSFEVERARIRDHILLIKLKGIDSRDAADALRGAYLSVTMNEIYPLDENSFYVFELEGMEICNSDGRRIGNVIRVERYPANDVLVVETETKDIMIPAVREFVREIDVNERRIIVDLPEELPSYPKGSG